MYSSNTITLAFSGVNIGNVLLLKLEKLRGFKNSSTMWPIYYSFNIFLKYCFHNQYGSREIRYRKY